MPVHPRLLLKGCAALLALLLSALSGARFAVDGGEDGSLRSAPAVEKALAPRPAAPLAVHAARPAPAGAAWPDRARPAPAVLAAPSPRCGSALGPRAPC